MALLGKPNYELWDNFAFELRGGKREEIGWCAIRKLNEAIDPFLGKEILDLERSIGFEKGKWQVMGAELQIMLNCHVV